MESVSNPGNATKDVTTRGDGGRGDGGRGDGGRGDGGRGDGGRGDAAAIAAGCALLATVEDADADALRGRMDGTADRSRFDDHVRHIRGDATAGATDAMGVLRQAKGDVNAAKRVFTACLDAAGGTEALSPAQTAKARSLCESLNLSPTQFGL